MDQPYSQRQKYDFQKLCELTLTNSTHEKDLGLSFTVVFFFCKVMKQFLTLRTHTHALCELQYDRIIL